MTLKWTNSRLVHVMVLALSLLACTVTPVSSVQAQKLASHRVDGYVSTAAISPDTRYLALNVSRSVQNEDGSWNNSEAVEVVNAKDMKIISKIDLPSATTVRNAALASSYAFVGYCDEGKYVVAFDKNAALYVIDSTSRQINHEIDLGLGNLHSQQALSFGTSQIEIGCSAGSDLVAVAASGGTFGAGVVRIFNLTSGEHTAELRLQPTSAILESISLSTSGSKLAILLRDARSIFNPLKKPNVEVCDTANMNIITRFSTGGTVKSISFAGETEVATLPIDKHGSRSRLGIQLWNTASGKEIKTLSDTHVDVQAPISVAANSPLILGYIPDIHKCSLCNGFEGRTEVIAQRISVWNMNSGEQVFRSESFGPMMPHISPLCVLSQDGKVALIFWPFTSINAKLITVH